MSPTVLQYEADVFNEAVMISDRPLLIFLNRYQLFVRDNRYAEPIFIYCYKVHK